MSAISTRGRLSTMPILAVLPAEDIERARDFYHNVLQLDVEDGGSHSEFIVHAGTGTRILVYERERTKAEHTAAAFMVDDLRATMAELQVSGVVFEEYDLPGLKTDHGIAETDSEYAAWFKDSEGNIIALTQMKPV